MNENEDLTSAAELLEAGKALAPGISTGLKSLDRLTGGLQPGTLWGMTPNYYQGNWMMRRFAYQLVLQAAAASPPAPCLIFSSRWAGPRMASFLAASYQTLVAARQNASPKVKMPEFRELPIYIDDWNWWTPGDLANRLCDPKQERKYGIRVMLFEQWEDLCPDPLDDMCDPHSVRLNIKWNYVVSKAKNLLSTVRSTPATWIMLANFAETSTRNDPRNDKRQNFAWEKTPHPLEIVSDVFLSSDFSPEKPDPLDWEMLTLSRSRWEGCNGACPLRRVNEVWEDLPPPDESN
jgi:hypothetical protein